MPKQTFEMGCSIKKEEFFHTKDIIDVVICS